MDRNVLSRFEFVYGWAQKIKHKYFPAYVHHDNKWKSTEIERRFNDTFEEEFSVLRQNLKDASKAQIGQDVLALMIIGKGPGYFVEFGATDGVALSNTYLLEESYSWRGILAEPGIEWQANLVSNRPKSHIDFRAIWTRSKEQLQFRQNRELGSLVVDGKNEDDKPTYLVETISLVDLLKEHIAPQEIDYLSVDIEGLEYDIITSGVLREFTFKLITIEHNYKMHRSAMLKFMRRSGYCRVFVNSSLWDDWFVKEEFAQSLLDSK